jgi:competence protein ComEC
MIKNSITYLIDSFFEERERWFLWLPVLFATGIGIYFILDFEPALWSGVIALELLVLFAYVARFRPALVFVSVCVGTILLGFTYMQMRSRYLQAPVISKKINFAKVSARVIKIEKFSRSYRILFDDVKIEKIKKEKTPKKIRIKFKFPDAKFIAGSYVSFNASLNPPSSPAVAGGYNFSRRAWFEQIGAVGFSFSRPKIIKAKTSISIKDRFLFNVDIFRKKIAHKIYEILPGEEGKICASLIAGERGEIPRKITDNYRDSGLAHMLSISGLHMGLFASLVYFVVRLLLSAVPFLSQRLNTKKIAAFLAIISITLYLFISGMRVPSQRAYFMTVVVLVGVLFDRRAISIRLIVWAGFVVLLFHPEALVSPSFQMSFAAVIALVSAYEAGAGKLSTFLSKKQNDEFVFESVLRVVASYIAGILLSDFIASLATTPYAIYHFNRVAVYTTLGNFLAAPFFGFLVMPFAVLSLFLSFVGLEQIPVLIMGWGVRQMNSITSYVASLSDSVMLVAQIPSYGLALLSLGGVWLCVWRKKWRLLGLIPIFIGVYSAFNVNIPDVVISEDASVVAVKVGKNLSIKPSKKGRFVKKTWLEFYGVEKKNSKSDKALQKALWGEGKSKRYLKLANDVKREKNVSISCDVWGCVYKTKGKVIAISEKEESHPKDCKTADIIFSKTPIRINCDYPELAIDRFDLWKNGSYSLWIKGETIKYITSSNVVGDRPWNALMARKNH